jgi:hypothetical protein
MKRDVDNGREWNGPEGSHEPRRHARKPRVGTSPLNPDRG